LFIKRDSGASPQAKLEDMSASKFEGKIARRDRTMARVVDWLPWLTVVAVSLPPPIIFLALFLFSSTTEAAAVYLFLALIAAAVGLGTAILLLVALLFYRKRWLQKFRDRLAGDGITASEVTWFLPELSTSERRTLKQLQAGSPLLADAYSEILASRLMATRVISRTRKDLMVVERRLNRLALMQGADTGALQKELREDQVRLANAKQEASRRLTETKARLQMIEAAASRDLNHGDTYVMLQRLAAAQEHLPLTFEMAQLERNALDEAEQEVQKRIPG
jgi:hypothetical protein